MSARFRAYLASHGYDEVDEVPPKHLLEMLQILIEDDQKYAALELLRQVIPQIPENSELTGERL